MVDMMTLDDVPEEEVYVHLLLIGDSKTGKSTYAAEAALAGFGVIYCDSDNGMSALKYRLRDDPEARKRVIPLPTAHPKDFLLGLLRARRGVPFNWIPSTGAQWSKLAVNVTADTVVWQIDATKIPKSYILVIDSWTSVAADALGMSDWDQPAKLLDGTDQAIYGEANSALTLICNILQKAPYHVIVQAHATKFEVWDKPEGAGGGQKIQQKDMILRETLDVPVSSSRPHGLIMGSRFNYIGWLGINNLGQSTIDFTRKPKRVGGGPPNRMDTTDKLSFAKLVDNVPPFVPAEGFVHRTTHGELMAAQPQVGLLAGVKK